MLILLRGQADLAHCHLYARNIAISQMKFIFYIVLQGCDASIMIQSPSGDAEKDASDNISLAGDGFDTVVRAKKVVEAKCPGVVSCADILAIAARDVVVLVRHTDPMHGTNVAETQFDSP